MPVFRQQRRKQQTDTYPTIKIGRCLRVPKLAFDRLLEG